MYLTSRGKVWREGDTDLRPDDGSAAVGSVPIRRNANPNPTPKP